MNYRRKAQHIQQQSRSPSTRAADNNACPTTSDAGCGSHGRCDNALAACVCDRFYFGAVCEDRDTCRDVECGSAEHSAQDAAQTVTRGRRRERLTLEKLPSLEGQSSPRSKRVAVRRGAMSQTLHASMRKTRFQGRLQGTQASQIKRNWRSTG